MFVCVGSVANTVTTLDNMVLRRGKRRRYRNGQNACVAHLSTNPTLRSPPVRKAKSHEVRRQPSRREGICNQSFLLFEPSAVQKSHVSSHVSNRERKKNSLFHEGKKSCIKIHRRA